MKKQLGNFARALLSDGDGDGDGDANIRPQATQHSARRTPDATPSVRKTVNVVTDDRRQHRATPGLLSAVKNVDPSSPSGHNGRKKKRLR